MTYLKRDYRFLQPIFLLKCSQLENLDSVPECMNSALSSVGMNDIHIDQDTVKQKLSTLRQDNAGGPDNLIPRLLIKSWCCL